MWCITPVVTRLFNRTLDSSTSPAIWKQGMVKALPKSGDKADCNNHRPITVLPKVRRIVERAKHRQLFAIWRGQIYLHRNSLVSAVDYQPISLPLALNLMMEWWLSQCLLTLPRPFDTVNHIEATLNNCDCLSQFPACSGLDFVLFVFVSKRLQETRCFGLVTIDFSGFPIVWFYRRPSLTQEGKSKRSVCQVLSVIKVVALQVLCWSVCPLNFSCKTIRSHPCLVMYWRAYLRGEQFQVEGVES